MISFRIFSVVALLGCLAFSSTASATIDNNAGVVKLRSPTNGGCMEGGVPLNNCFIDMSSLVNWAMVMRTPKPLSGSPLAVDIGPGQFSVFTCAAQSGSVAGYISLNGAGVDKTFVDAMTLANGCKNISVSNMTIGAGGFSYAVAVFASGVTTTWNNVKLVGGSPWSESCVNGGGGKHTWFATQIAATRGGSYKVGCDQSWFYGSEISSTGFIGGTLIDAEVIPLLVTGGEVHVYGSVIRALGKGTTASYGITAVKVSGGEAHIHGTGIDVIAVNNAPAVVTAFDVSGGTIHANETSYNMQTGPGGTKNRISNPGNLGHVHAPYMWEPHSTLPDVVSVTGADIAVVTDGAQPHLVIYSEACTSTKWFDTSTNACR